MLTGTFLVFAGAWSIFPPKIINKVTQNDEITRHMDKQFFWLNVPIAIMLVVVVALAIGTGGRQSFKTGIDATVATTSGFALMLVILMPVMGFSIPVFKYFEAVIIRALEGPFGYAWALVSAFIVPGGNTMSAVVQKIWTTKPVLRPLLLYFLTITPLISATIYFVRTLGLGKEITTAMYKTNWIVAIGLYPCFRIYARFFFHP